MLPPDVRGRRFVPRTVQWRACRWPSCPRTSSPIISLPRGIPSGRNAPTSSTRWRPRWRGQGGAVLAPRPATLEELAAVHDRDHIERIAATAGRAAMLDPDTFTSPESYDLARLAAGAALVGVDHAMAGGGPALVLVRPPGHHAERDRAMGFCLFNNVAVAAAYARAQGASRVAMVDIDVHHGNGTQQIFEDDPRVLYVSTHQYPCYPGTGAATEVGFGDGPGTHRQRAHRAGRRRRRLRRTCWRGWSCRS